MRWRARRARWLAPVLVALVLAGAGCGDGDDGDAPPIGSYVAIGDSYTTGTGAGPLVDDAGGTACGQVGTSYPRLVAEALGAELTDASCAGARTSDATGEQTTGSGAHWPPQLDRVSKGTDLVTVGLGYNDLGFFSQLTVGCAAAAGSDPTGTPCAERNRAQGVDPGSMADQVGDHLRDLLDQVHQRAPDARVLLVGYPQLVPPEGTCPELPLAAGDYPYVRERFAHLDDAMRAAASDTGSTFVDVYDASSGHDICAGAGAWVDGYPASTRAAAYHPFAVEHRAVADLILAEFDQD
ncbi:MAG TPA: SGNH/GDSL hydrolase family protein [Nocardioides sp.]|uniref:SGNH/GDSL hydrolase family protein n=1 Tax=Nocardioides sp. TaxID=35761 RepID=UPI002E3541D0|nr:SGNH/GDSL hydrolase family protein [Nocardioides sp.]HEX5086641.1 SGNH/GDSL hydrolase family protein [Nocardioides sp.]